MEIPTLKLLLLLVLMMQSSLWPLAAGHLNNTRDCNVSCSKEVNCTISPYTSGFCGAEGDLRTNGTHGPDIAAGPVGLQVDTDRDSEYQYIKLSWRPPRDGSYNYLTGFLIQVTVISLELNKPGLSSISCYRVVPDPGWYQIHRSLQSLGGVGFFMNCLRFDARLSLHIVVSIHSLPLKKEIPKLAMTDVVFEPDGIYWNPGFDKWADVDDVMHLVIRNPLQEAKFYAINIKSVRHDLVVFAHNFSAVPDSTDKLVVVNSDGLPHFLVPGLIKNDNYSIVLEVLDGNKTSLTHIHRVVSKPFTLNFTGSGLASTSAGRQQLDNRLIIVVSTAVVVFMALLVCLVWKGFVKPSKLRNMIENCVGELSGTQPHENISFTPIYCYENENFVCAVENHVNLLRRCLEKLTAQNPHHSHLSLCCPKSRSQSCVDVKNKGHNVIIYLSPRLKEILTFGPVPPSHCSKLDVLCHQSLQSLHELFQKGQGLAPMVVTFDCFQQAELAALSELTALFPLPQQADDSQLITPLRLASFNRSGVTLENMEQLLARFQCACEFTLQTAERFHSWRDCSEVRAIERCLSVLGESAIESCKELSIGGQEGLCSVSENCDTSFCSHASSHCAESMARSVSENIGDQQEDSEMGINQDGVTFLPDAPLISSSSCFQSGSELHVSNNHVDKISLSNNRVDKISLSNNPVDKISLSNNYNCSEFSQDSVEASPKSTYTNDKITSQSLYYQSQREAHQLSDERSFPIKDGRPSFKLHSIIRYKPNNFSDHTDKADVSSANSVESDCLLKSNDLSAGSTSIGQYFKDVTDDLEWGHHRVVKARGSFIPPSLNHSNFTSMESVCERINRVNEHSGWSELNLSK